MKTKLFADIGNTTIDFYYKSDENHFFKVEKSYINKIQNILQDIDFSDIYISCVDYKCLEKIKVLLADKNIHLLTPQIMDRFAKENNYTITNTSYLGNDLFCDIIAKDCPNGMIIVDLGTASKILFIDDDKIFYGCQIFPGLTSFPKTLNAQTDLLKTTKINNKPKLVSLITDECISSGVINGTSALIANMVKAIKKEYHCEECKIVLTGGNGILVKDTLPLFGLSEFEYDELHVIKGLIKVFSQEEIS